MIIVFSFTVENLLQYKFFPIHFAVKSTCMLLQTSLNFLRKYLLGIRQDKILVIKILYIVLRTSGTYIYKNLRLHCTYMGDEFYIKLGKNIKKRRKEIGLTQQELAERLELSLNFIGKIEVAFSKPSLETLLKIADCLDITISDLCKFDNQNT